MAQSLGTKENPVCGSDLADVRMNIVGNQSDGLTIFPILLDSKSDLELRWEFLQFAHLVMIVNDAAFAVIEFPVIQSKCFHNTFTQRVFVFTNFRLSLLCILRAT